MAGRGSVGSTPRVLVVDDEPAVCETLAGVLAARGFDPVCTGSDHDARAALKRRGQRFACLVVDVNLGAGVTGFDVARFARGFDPGLPILYVSGQTGADMAEVNGVEGSRFFDKPFTPEELVEAIGELIGERRG